MKLGGWIGLAMYGKYQVLLIGLEVFQILQGVFLCHTSTYIEMLENYPQGVGVYCSLPFADNTCIQYIQ